MKINYICIFEGLLSNRLKKKKKVSSLPALKTVNSVKARMAFYTSFLQPAMSNGKAKHNFFLVG